MWSVKIMVREDTNLEDDSIHMYQITISPYNAMMWSNNRCLTPYFLIITANNTCFMHDISSIAITFIFVFSFEYYSIPYSKVRVGGKSMSFWQEEMKRARLLDWLVYRYTRICWQPSRLNNADNANISKYRTQFTRKDVEMVISL